MYLVQYCEVAPTEHGFFVTLPILRHNANYTQRQQVTNIVGPDYQAMSLVGFLRMNVVEVGNARITEGSVWHSKCGKEFLASVRVGTQDGNVERLTSR